MKTKLPPIPISKAFKCQLNAGRWLNYAKQTKFRFLKLFVTFFITNSFVTFAQYVHPNQAGRKGGDTGPGIGSQVVTTTYLGNAGNYLAQGVIMSVNKDGTNASSFHDFDGYPGDGSYPFYTTPFHATDGKLYGNTYIGGAWNWGSVYTYDFSNCSEYLINSSGPGGAVAGSGVGNYANLNELSDGRIYTVNTFGGRWGYGAIFSMDKDGTDVDTVHIFSYASDSNFPLTPLTIDLVNYSAAAVAQSILPKYDGAYPYGFVVEGADGKIYGTTYSGGSYNYGSIFRCNKDGSSYEIINIGDPTFRFTYKNGLGATIAGGAFNPLNFTGNVAIDQTGKIYTAGLYGGVSNLGGWGRMDPDGGNYQILKSGTLLDGDYPRRGPLIIDNKLYSPTQFGGSAANGGSIVSMNLDGTGYTILKAFNELAFAEGAQPWADLSYDGTHLFGTTIIYGGLGKVGTIFKIKPDGTGFQTIHRFSDTAPTLADQCANGTKGGLWTYYPSAERVTFIDVNMACGKTCVVNAAPCLAPNTAPTILGTTLSNKCQTLTADLTTLSVGNASPVTWHTGTPANAGNKVLNETSVPAGSYYAVFYDNVNDCYSAAASAAVAVTIVKCYNTLALNAQSFAITTPQDVTKPGNTATDTSPVGQTSFSYSSVDCTSAAVTSTTVQGGIITVTASTGAYTYTPPSGFTGLDYFCVKICDGNTPTQICKTVSYTVTVTPEDCDARGTVPQN